MSEHNIYAVVGADNQVLAVEETEQAARRAGHAYSSDVVMDESLETRALEENPKIIDPEYAHQRVGNLVIDLDKAMDLSLEEAHARLLPYFPERRGKPVKKYLTPDDMAKGLLGQNDKTEKTDLSYEQQQALKERYPKATGVYVEGLTLLPNVTWAKITGKRGINTCVGASAECIAACLVYSGRNDMDPYNVKIKTAKTNALFGDPTAFGRMLFESCRRRAEAPRTKKAQFVRLNVFSDIPWEVVFPELFTELEGLQFYDYTKVPNRVLPENYDITFSYSGRNLDHVAEEFDNGRRVAVVFLTDKHKLPAEFMGVPVVDGDLSDVRPLDPPQSVVGLAYKPPLKAAQKVKAGAEESVFIVPVQEVDGKLVAAVVPRDQPGVRENTDGDVVPKGVTVPGVENMEFLHESDLVPEGRLTRRNNPETRELKARLLR